MLEKMCIRCKVQLNPMGELNQFRCPVCYTVTEIDPEEYIFRDDPKAIKEQEEDLRRYKPVMTHVNKKTEMD